ncbi:MAG: hypothetical protein IJP32_10725, partial [Clostridia bacterium]|nr:hypothetical protein [Clostridia bacterium]
MKKILSMLLAVAMVATLAISASAGLFVFDSSDSEYWDAALNMLDKTQKVFWMEDGAAADWSISVDANSVEYDTNKLSNLESGWYEIVLCDLGTNPEWFPADVAGKVALTLRGDSTFTVKSTNALDAGAVACLVGNNCRDEELIDEEGNVTTGTYQVTNMSVEYETLPMGMVSSDVTVRLVSKMTGLSMADTVAAVREVFGGKLELGLEAKNTAWMFFGTEEEYKANTTRTDANTKTGAGAAAPAAAEAPAAGVAAPVLTIDFANGAGDVELVNAELVNDSERGQVLQINGVGTSETGASYGLLKTDVFEKTDWENGMTVNMWVKTADSSTLHGTAPIFSLDIANVGYIALTTSLESAINTDGNDTSLGIAPRIWTDPANVGGGINMTDVDTWQMLTVVYNEDHIDLYVDGELFSDHPFANGNATDLTAMFNLMLETNFVYSVRLGSWLCSWWKYGDYEGCIDDFTVYNSYLSADEVAAIYAATKDVEVAAAPEAPAAEAAPAGETIGYAHYVASANDPYFGYDNTIDIDPEVVTWAQIKYRTITEKDSLDNTLTGQIYVSPAAEPFIPVK